MKSDEIVDFENVSRRGFVAGSGALVMGIWLGGCRAGAKKSKSVGNASGSVSDAQLFISIHPDSRIELTCHRSEMGQQTLTAMAQLLAEELEAEWGQIVVAQADGDAKYGDQNTDGSRSVRQNFTRLRMAGASMRVMLEGAAAKRWKVEPKSCVAELGKVHHQPTKRVLSFGELAGDAAKVPVPKPETVVLKAPESWRYINHSVPSFTVPKIVRGEGTFGIDVRIPGMLYAVVARPSQVFGSVKKLSNKAALALPGVLKTVTLEPLLAPAKFKALGGVAVVAKDTWAAIKGRQMLYIEWNEGASPKHDSDLFAKELQATASQRGKERRNRGDVYKALKLASKKIAAEYYVPHLAHSPMEPPVATARWDGDNVECWACVQAPQAARKAVAEACKIDEAQVTIHVTWLGGGFGRKSKPDFVVEAALVAREAKAPVKLMWTREDDLQHGYYHTVSAQRLEGGLDAKGTCQAFLHRTVFPPIGSTFSKGASEPSWGELRLGASDTPFAVPNLRLESGNASAHLRTGWLRSVSNIYHAFSVQSFVGELAAAAERDPKDYLLELIGSPRHVNPNDEGAEYDNYGSPLEDYPFDTARLSHVTRKAAEMAQWGRKLKPRHGLGIAAHRSFASYVATVVEVMVAEDGTLKLEGVWSAIDAGTVVNPRNVEAQVEGGTLFGLSNALFGEITAEAGKVVQSNFPLWRIMRMNESPRRMDVHVVASKAPPGGVGEAATPPAAPALANAIFAASGKRLRTLPLIGTDPNNRLRSTGDEP